MERHEGVAILGIFSDIFVPLCFVVLFGFPRSAVLDGTIVSVGRRLLVLVVEKPAAAARVLLDIIRDVLGRARAGSAILFLKLGVSGASPPAAARPRAGLCEPSPPCATSGRRSTRTGAAPRRLPHRRCLGLAPQLSPAPVAAALVLIRDAEDYAGGWDCLR